MIAGRILANQYGWKIGAEGADRLEHLPAEGRQQGLGRSTWSASTTARTRNGSAAPTAAGSTSHYFDEANQFGSGRAGVYIISLEDPDRAGRGRGDHRRACSRTRPDETKTQTEKDFNLGFFKQIGDIGLIVRWILFAVFFTLLLVVGNTIAQSVRERIPELAILKTLGFTDRQRARLRAGGGGRAVRDRRPARAGIATPLGIAITKASGGNLPVAVDHRVWITGLVAIVVLTPRGWSAAGNARQPPDDRRRSGRALREPPSMLKQTAAITMLGLRSIPERIGPSLVIVVGLAGVVAVFTALLAMAAGFQSTLQVDRPGGCRAGAARRLRCRAQFRACRATRRR